jgi:hypothetical protein
MRKQQKTAKEFADIIAARTNILMISRPSHCARRMTDDGRRMLELLAASEDGCTDALLLAQGFTLQLMVCLVHAGFVTADSERIFAGRGAVEISRVRITEAGRRAQAERW